MKIPNIWNNLAGMLNNNQYSQLKNSAENLAKAKNYIQTRSIWTAAKNVGKQGFKRGSALAEPVIVLGVGAIMAAMIANQYKGYTTFGDTYKNILGGYWNDQYGFINDWWNHGKKWWENNHKPYSCDSPNEPPCRYNSQTGVFECSVSY